MAVVERVPTANARARRDGVLAGVGLGAVGIVLFLALWELYCLTAGRSLNSIASPIAAVRALGPLSSAGLGGQLAHTIEVTLEGWLLATVSGCVVGSIIGLSSFAHRYLQASVEVLRSIPSIAFIPIALLLFGFSSKMELSISVYVSQWPILMGLIGGIRSTNPGLLDVARTFHLSKRATILKVVLGGALPSLLVGMRLGLTLSVAMSVVAEMLGNPAGLGYGMAFAQQAFHADQVFAYLLVIGLVGWGLNYLFVILVRRLAPGHAEGL